jgi:hypothetical protein
MNWNQRVAHVRVHFQTGLTIEDWDLSKESINISRQSRMDGPSPLIFGCSSCLRGFRHHSDLGFHERRPHLPQSEWTCGDLFTALVAQIPDTPLQDDHNTAIIRCHHCNSAPITYATFFGWRTALISHIGQHHRFQNCRRTFISHYFFVLHLNQDHTFFLSNDIVVQFPVVLETWGIHVPSTLIPASPTLSF